MRTLFSEIVRHLPRLLRYAVALSGSKALADEHVRICLETVVQEPFRIIPDEDVRLQLFQVFHEVTGTLDSAAPTPRPEAGNGRLDTGALVQDRLARLSPSERRVLLLVVLEGFPYEETSYILGLPEAEVRDHLKRARETLARTGPILIIEDEPLTALHIAQIVKDMGHTVCGPAAQHRQAVALAEEARPSLIIADLMLKGGESGCAAVKEIVQKILSPAIFVTAFPEKVAEDSFEPASVLAKPFSPESLKSAIERALLIQSMVAEDILDGAPAAPAL